MDKAVVKHNLLENPFHIPMRIRKRLPIEKSTFDLFQPQVKLQQPPTTSTQQQCQLIDPLIMDSALIKSLLFGRIQSYLILMSLIISCLVVYKYQHYISLDSGFNDDGKFGISTTTTISSPPQHQQQQSSEFVKYNLLLLESFMSGLLIVMAIVGQVFHNQANKIRGIKTKYFNKVVKVGVFVLHPNVWMQDVGYLMHFLIVLRLPFLISYCIKTSTYHTNRSFRLTDIYGIKPSQNFFFSVKSIFNQMKIQQIVLMYILIVFLFSHCLYLSGMSDPNGGISFWSCFEIIIVTLTTIGYGQYSVTNLMQRGIIVLAVVIGSAMNSLVTLIMLRQFEMSTQQMSAYNLLRKINLKQRMQFISRQYIVSTIKQLRSTNFHTLKNRREWRRQTDSNFKQQYKYLKSRYNQINTRDISSMFTLFKQQLKQLRVSFGQINNLVFVLLGKLLKQRVDKNDKLDNDQ